MLEDEPETMAILTSAISDMGLIMVVYQLTPSTFYPQGSVVIKDGRTIGKSWKIIDLKGWMDSGACHG